MFPEPSVALIEAAWASIFLSFEKRCYGNDGLAAALAGWCVGQDG
jgi:hypothetical protein